MSKSTVNNELYKFTDEYKESSLNSALIRQYIFILINQLILINKNKIVANPDLT